MTLWRSPWPLSRRSHACVTKAAGGSCGSEDLADRIRAHRAVVGVVGQGSVGFALAQRIAQRGFQVLGYDVNGDTVLRCGSVNRSRRYRAVVSIMALRACDVLVVAVPVGTRVVDGASEPDLSPVLSAVRMLSNHVLDATRQRLLVIESTYAPGTTRGALLPLLSAHHALGTTLLVGYSPERFNAGRDAVALGSTPKIVSGFGAAATELTQLFYSQFIETVLPASSVEAAESTSILENVFRFINITFVQEFDSFCDRLGLDVEEVTRLAATKPFGFMHFYPGYGIGGHNIVESPYFLREAMSGAGMTPTLLSAAVEIHETRVHEIVERIVRALGGRPIHGARILLLGVAYKPDVADTRGTPALQLIGRLCDEGAEVDYHDRYVPRFAARTSVELEAMAPASYDLAVVLTQHQHIDYAALEAAGWKLFGVTRTSRRAVERARWRPAGRQPVFAHAAEVRS